MGTGASKFDFSDRESNPRDADNPGRFFGDYGGKRDTWRRVLVPQALKKQELDQRYEAAQSEIHPLLESYDKLRQLVELINTNDAFTNYQITHSVKDPFQLPEIPALERQLQTLNDNIQNAQAERENSRNYERSIQGLESVFPTLKDSIKQGHDELKRTLTLYAKGELKYANDVLEQFKVDILQIKEHQNFKDFDASRQALWLQSNKILHLLEKRGFDDLIQALKTIKSDRERLNQDFKKLQDYIKDYIKLQDIKNTIQANIEHIKNDYRSYKEYVPKELLPKIKGSKYFEELEQSFEHVTDKLDVDSALVAGSVVGTKGLSELSADLERRNATLSQKFNKFKTFVQVRLKIEQKKEELLKLYVKKVENYLKNKSAYPHNMVINLEKEYSRVLNNLNRFFSKDSNIITIGEMNSYYNSISQREEWFIKELCMFEINLGDLNKRKTQLTIKLAESIKRWITQ